MATVTRRFGPLAGLIVLSACASGGDPKSPAYGQGFADGCATANAEGSRTGRAPQRDAALYQSDANYREGWLSGHAACAPPPSNLGR
jgi:hypothetical protein